MGVTQSAPEETHANDVLVITREVVADDGIGHEGTFCSPSLSASNASCMSGHGNDLVDAEKLLHLARRGGVGLDEDLGGAAFACAATSSMETGLLVLRQNNGGHP